jgi:hypothetical protein
MSRLSAHSASKNPRGGAVYVAVFDAQRGLVP